MARAAPKLAGKQAVEKEMSQIEATRKVRFGIGLKFTLPVTLALSLAIIIMGLVVYGSMADSLEFQLNAQGIFAAKIAASPEIDSWEEQYNTREDLLGRITRIEAEIAVAGGAGTIGDATSNSAGLADDVVRKIQNHETRQKQFNRRRLAGLLGSQGALDVWVVDRDQSLVASAAGGAPNFVEVSRFEMPSSPETKIITGTYQNQRGEMEPARFFAHPIKNSRGETVGQATVVVSEQRFRADLGGVRSDIWLFCIFGIVVCVIVALATSRIITGPIHALLKDIRTVASGKLDHRTKSRSNDEIGNLAVTFDQMTRNLAAAEVMRVDLADKSHQVNIAHEVQERLFPEQLPQPEGLVLEASNRLAGDLSSDLFDAIELEGGRIGCLVMTSSGRGMPAAIILSMARALFRARSAETTSPAEALRALNRFLTPDLRSGMYLSAIYAVIDPATGSGTLASAGHRVPGLIYVAEKSGLRKIQADGIAVGLDQGPVFDRSLTEATFTLATGDRLLLATEGALLLAGPDGKALGETEFLKVVLALCKRNTSPSGILGAFAERLGDDPGDEDLTLVTATKS